MNTQDTILSLAQRAMEASEQTFKALHDACSRGRLHMSIPVSQTDDDILIDDQLRRTERLAEAVVKLMPFVQHQPYCRVMLSSAPAAVCDCGLNRALSEIEGGGKEGRDGEARACKAVRLGVDSGQ